MAEKYDIGYLRRLQATFLDINDTAADPTTVTFKIKTPDGTITEYVYGTDSEVVKSSTGVYYVDWTITQGGKHMYRWQGTGSIVAAEEGLFNSKNSIVV